MPPKTKAELAAENAALRERLTVLEGLLEASRTVMAGLDLQATLNQIAAEASRIARCNQVKVLLVDREAQALRISLVQGVEAPPQLPWAHGLSGRVAQTGQPLFVANSQDESVNPLAAFDREKGLRTYLGLPIKRAEEVLGVLTFNTSEPREYSQEEMAYLTSFADQAAVAIENAGVHEAALRRGEELEALLRASRTVMAGLDLQSTLNQIAAEASRIARCTQVKVLLVDREAQALRISLSQGVEAPPELPWSLGRGLSGRVAQTGQPLFVANSQDESVNPNASFDREKGLRTYLGLPIKRAEEVLGVLTFNTTEPREYSQEEMAYLTSFADQAAIAIENARLYQTAQRELAERREAELALQRRTLQLEAVRAVGMELIRELDPSRLLDRVIREAAGLLGAVSGAVWLWNPAEEHLEPGAFIGHDPAWFAAIRLRMGEGVAGTVAQRRAGLIVADVHNSPLRAPVFRQRATPEAVMAEPLLYQDRMVGTISLDRRASDPPFTAQDQEVLRLFVAQAAIAIENARLYEAAQRELGERRRVEAALQEKTGELDRFFTMALDLLCIADTDGRFRRVNPAWTSVLGYESGELEGRRFLDLVHPDDMQATLAATELAAQKPLLNFVNRYRSKDGSYRWIEWRSSPYQGALIYAAARDITDRKRTEAALMQSEERLALALEASNDALYDVDMPTGLAYVSPRYFTMLGHEPTELPASLETWSNLLHPDDRQAALVAMQEYAENRRDSHTLEFRLRTKSGDWRWILSRGRVVARDATGRPLRLVGTHVDITERKEAEAERHRFEAQMQHTQKLESLGVLAGGIAHDFNNLLVSILGHAELTLLELPPASPSRNHIREIEAASQRAADLCRQMLAYSGKGRFVVEAFNLSEIVREMTHILEVAISKKASLRYELASQLPTIQADATQIRQVIMNLIINASEALEERPGDIWLTTGVMHCDRAYLAEPAAAEELAEGPYVYLEVSDSGCGMNEATRARIFDPFFSTKFVGRGLGLAAVLGIVRGHGGAVKVYTEVGKGTTFKLLFPASAEPVDQRHRGPAVDAEWRGQGLVLLVDDEAGVRETGKQLLEYLGFTVLTAPDGRQALEIFRERAGDISCVLLDLTMPCMDGEETLRELRRVRSEVRVVLSSGYNQQDVTQRFAGKRLAGFVQKPYSLEALRRTLRGVVGDAARSGRGSPERPSR